MEKVTFNAITKFYDENKDHLKIALINAKAAISAARPKDKTSPMNDTECLAYAQAICVAEQQCRDLEFKQKHVVREVADKYDIYDKEEIKSKPEYKKITKSLEDSKKIGMNIFKQALMRNPDDEQLRLLCAGSFAYDYKPSQETIFVKILEDPEIAKNTALSIRIIDAAMQWRQATDNNAGYYDDYKMVKEFITKNFDPKVMATGVTGDKDFDLSKHPGYERGVHLLGILEQRISGSQFKHKAIADETIGCLYDINSEVLQSAFETSPRLTKAYSNLIKSYKEAHVRAAMEDLNYVPSYKTYDRVMTTKSPEKNKLSGRTED